MASLEVYHRDTLVFSSNGQWLRPLLELEAFLVEHPVPAEELLVRDRVVGRAAALLLVRLGIRRVNAGVLSRPAQEVLERFDVEHSAEELVARVACRTETELLDEWDPDRAHRLIHTRVAEARMVE